MKTYHSDKLGRVTIPESDTTCEDLLRALKDIIRGMQKNDPTMTRKDRDALIREIATEAIAKAEGRA